MRIEQLTFTRFIAAISIVIFHFGRNSFLFNNEYVSFIFRQANVGVSYFFVLSGFVLTIVYSQRKEFNAKQYFINRLARVYPLYIFAIFLILFVKGFKFIRLQEFILNITMLQSWIPKMAMTLNYPGWSLSVELLFYACFPLIFSFLRKKSLSFSAITILIFWITSQVFYQLISLDKMDILFYSIKDIQFHPIFHLNEFFIGILTGFVFIKTPKTFASNSINMFLGMSLVILLIFLLKYPLDLRYHNGLLAVIFSPIIFLISKNNGRISTFFSGKVFIYLGEISYGIYLLQYPVWGTLTDYRLEKYFGVTNSLFNNTTIFFIRFMVLILLAAFSFRFIEGPMRKSIRKLGAVKNK